MISNTQKKSQSGERLAPGNKYKNFTSDYITGEARTE